MILYHSTTTPINEFRIKGNCGYGVYFASAKKYSQTFGDITYRVKLTPNNTLIFNDNEVRGKGFFNMSELQFNDYIKAGYDSLAWYRKGKLAEFIALTTDIIIDKNLMY